MDAGMYLASKPALGIEVESPQRPRSFGGARTCNGKPDPIGMRPRKKLKTKKKC